VSTSSRGRDKDIMIIPILGPLFSMIGSIASGWLKHKQAKTEAIRDVEIASIRAQVDIQKGSWKDEYLVIMWTMPLWPAIFDSVLHWDPYMTVFLEVVNGLPVWYTTMLIGMTTASFGVKAFQNWKANKLDREIIWERATNNKHTEPKKPAVDIQAEYLKSLER
jgi:hypothetical protein